MDPVTNLVSVIIPFYNEERFLGEAIQSVLQQTYPHWEIILIDDGSSDSSTALAKDYATRYPNQIFYMEHEGHANKGLSSTRNAGIATARGQWIALLDADDVWLPEKLQKQVAIFQQHPELAMACEASLYWRTWHDSPYPDGLNYIGVPGDTAYAPPQLALQLYPLGRGAAPCPSSLMIKSLVLKSIGGFEASFTGANQMYEDQPFLAKMYLSHTVFVSADCNNKYRQRPGSLVHDVKAKGKYDAVRHYFLQWLQGYIKNKGIKNRPVQAALARALVRYKYPALYKCARFIKRTFVRPTAHGQLKKL
jgi:glycosyltransferase involved in cell wall biosynthesis